MQKCETDSVVQDQSDRNIWKNTHAFIYFHVFSGNRYAIEG